MFLRLNDRFSARADIGLSVGWYKTAIFCLLSTVSFSSFADVVISEFMASNDSTLFDQDGDDEDWIELHNDGTSSVSINGWYLTDDDGELTKWQFPNITLSPDEYLIVFASDKERDDPNSELHTNFKLSSGGEYLALIEADGSTIVSEYAPEYPEQFDDISYGLGSYFDVPTPGALNGSGVSGFAEPVEFGLEHGFFSTPQTLSLNSSLSGSVIRYTLDGSLPSTDLGCSAPSDGNAWSYQYYENNGSAWTSMPEFDSLIPVISSTSNSISTDVRERDDNFGLVFNGCVQALEDGYYLFQTTSDDGSQLFVDGSLVVDNVSPGSTATDDNEIYLDKGLHEVSVWYYQATGTSEVSSQWSAPRRGQTVVLTPDDGIIYPASDQLNNFVEFEFDLPSDGTYRFDAVVRGIDTNSDTFWVQLNEQNFIELNTGIGSFQAVTALSATLDAGEHTLKIYPREDGAILDSIAVVGTDCDGPCETQTFEAENQTVSGEYVFAGLETEELHAEKWLTYSSPITIDQTTIIRANAVKQGYVSGQSVTQSYIWLDDVIVQSRNEETPPYWTEETGAQDMDYGMDPSIVDNNELAVKESLASLPSISLVTDIDNLLHPSLGIYVNALERGRDWERPASIELLDGTNNEEGFTIDAGIRIRGGGSRNSANPRHPFRVFFRNQYGGDLDYPLFGDEGVDVFEKIDFRAANNYSWANQGSNSVLGERNTFLREVWSRDTQAALDAPYTRSRYYHLYINGQYWGVHMTQERVSKEYAESYFGGDEDDYDVVKHSRVDDFRFQATDGTTHAWNDLWDIVSDQQVTATEYILLDQQVDLDNLIDYIVSNGYEGDLDGAVSWFLRDSSRTRWSRANNWYAVRNRESDNSKWVFFQHDSEHSLGVSPTQAIAERENTLAPHAPFDGTSNSFFSQNYFNPYWLHAALSSNSDYRQRAIDRTAVLFADGGVFSTDKALERWNKREAELTGAILAQSARWGDSKRTIPYDINDWLTEVANVESSFFPGRSETVYAQLVALGLASDIELTVSIPTGTEVQVGTVVTITSNSSGTIYYTLDGSDPRLSGGVISPNAIALTNGEFVIDSDVELTFRLLNDGSWSVIDAVNYSVSDAPVNLIQNGSFESVTVANNYVITSSFESWTKNGNGAAEFWRSGFKGQLAQDGNILAELDVNKNTVDSLSQEIVTQVGMSYDLSVYLKARPGTNSLQNELIVLWNDQQVGFFVGGDSWAKKTIRVVGTGNDKVTFSETVSGNTSLGTHIDNISLIETTDTTTPIQTTNLAIGKQASQSSTRFRGVASRAVDGNANGVWRNKSVTHTANSNQPWWQVDLGAPSSIQSVILSNRTDACCSSRLSNFYVLVSNEPFEDRSLLALLNDPNLVNSYHTGLSESSLTIDFDGVGGRYVRIQLEGTEALSLAEVEVMGSQ